MQRLPGAIFQQDSVRPHTARVSQDCLRTVTTLPWPARSSDLSPIKHIWDQLGWRVGHPTSLNELEAKTKQRTTRFKIAYLEESPQKGCGRTELFLQNGIRRESGFQNAEMELVEEKHSISRRRSEIVEVEIEVVSPSIVPSGNFAELNRTVTCMVLKANDRRTSCPCHDEFRGPRSDYVRQRCIFQRTIDKYSACVEVGKPIDENSACVEVGTTHKHLRRGDKSNNFKNYFSSNDITCEEVKSVDSQRFFFIGYIVRESNKEPEKKKKKGRIFLNFYKMYKNALKEDLIRVVENLDGTVESTDTIVKLKTKIENSSTFESDPDFVKTLIQNCIDERVSQNEREVTSEQKIELAKLQLAKLEKEIELQLAKNKALSLNPAAKVEEKQFETNIENMIKKEELNDYEKLKSIVLREFQLTPRECLNSFKNAVKSSGETYIQFAARLTANFQYYCSLRKVNSFESLCDLIISDKLYETLNKETATHIGIREAEDWFRPIDLAKECDIYISSKNGSHKETPITYGYTQDPFKNRSQNFKPKSKENYPQYLERENKNCFICGDSSHCARDCEKRFKPKESNDHIHNKINVNTLKVESEKQNSDECANLQYVNIFVENQPVTALIDSGCQIPVLNSSLIRVQTPSEEIITLSSCFGEQRMVEVKSINISLNQQSPSLSVRTAISPTLTEEFIIHPSVYSEIEKLGHAKSDVLLSESGSSLSADLGVQFNSSVPFPNVSVSNVIENSSYDLSHVKNFNTRNDSSSLIKDYKCNKIKSTKLKLSIVREKCSDIVLCKKANGAMKTSSVEFISRSPNPLPMKSEHRRFVLLRKIFEPWQWKRRKKKIVLNRRPELYRGKYRCVQPKINLLKKTFSCL
ncbi:retrovirus-related Pol polyprotein from transposon 412 [Trichonephila clavipes]|uniref:Retrovirus-related Pol polyprotein from transposon 412 n=1 Tax=Trichonephila clavipes TaxID=2585209 RepID=A0A8X6SKS5_TRICX|nr:retrovirus-related Pol polyprotein from transposon 412 [Trichonephila clavipes]